MEGLTPEFLKKFKGDVNLFFSQLFVENISYEYGLFDKTIDVIKALKIYKDATDYKYDYLCIYRMNRFYLMDYNFFNVKKNWDLNRLNQIIF